MEDIFSNKFEKIGTMSHKYFRDGAFNPPAGHEDDIKHMQDWLKGQPHLPSLSDEHLYLFLNSCEYQITRSKETLENYYTFRTSSPELFSNRNALLPELQAYLDICHHVPVIWTSPEGYKAAIFRLSDYDPAKFDFTSSVKLFCMFNDMRMSDEGLPAGLIVIIDLKGTSLAHVAKLHINVVRKALTYVQECQPVALKAIHLVNTPPFTDKIMMLAKPFMKSELMDMIKFHPSHEGLASYIPLKYLPAVYGGESEPIDTLHAKYRAMMEKDYAEWFQQEETLKVDESKRIGKKHQYSQMSYGVDGSFRKLTID